MSVQIVKWPENLTHEGWLRLRKQISVSGLADVKIGASEIGVITGSSKWSSLRRLFLAKAGLYEKNFCSDAMVLGHHNEATIQAYWEGYDPENYDNTLFNSLHGIKLRNVEKAKFFVLNDKYNHLFASPDFIATENYYSPLSGRLVTPMIPHEAKFISQMSYKEWDNGISQAYFEQMQSQMLLSESEFGIFLPLQKDTGGTQQGFRPIEVEADKDVQEYIVHKTGEFCIDVVKVKILDNRIKQSTDQMEIEDLKAQIEDLVPIDGFDDTVDVMKETHIGNIDELRLQEEDDSEAGGLLKEYTELQQSEKNNKYSMNEVKSKLFKLAEGFEGINTPSYSATIRGNNSTKGSYFKVTTKKK